ncbi:ribonuclease H-like domain-containing protein [Tanacetum coccineum]
MSTLTFTDTHNIVAFLEKPVESEGFHEIINFLNANQIHHALIVNPTLYTSCIKQFWTTAKVKTVNQEVQIQALIDGNKVFINKQVDSLSKHKETYVIPSHSKKIFANIRRKVNRFSGRVTPLFPTMLVQEHEQRSKKNSKKKTTKVSHPSRSFVDVEDEPITPISHDPPHSGEDSMQLTELMNLYTKLSDRVLALETTKATQAVEIATLKKRVKNLEKKEDASKQGRSNEEMDDDNAVVDDYNEMDDDNAVVDDYNEATKWNDNLMFDTTVLEGEEVVSTAKKEVTEVTTAPSIPTVDIEVSAASLLKKSNWLKHLLNAKPKEKDVVAKTSVSAATTMAKDKGKGIMVEPKKPLSLKAQLKADKQLARELEIADQEAERLEREEAQRQEQANINLINSWDNTQAMIKADQLLVERLQAMERKELTKEQRLSLFMQLLEKKRKFFAAKRAEAKMSKPLTQA